MQSGCWNVQSGFFLVRCRRRKDDWWNYRPEQIAEIIKAEKEDWKIGILLSGDIGFFSGAKKLEKVLEGFADEVILVPGISSVVYLKCKNRDCMGGCSNHQSSRKK